MEVKIVSTKKQPYEFIPSVMPGRAAVTVGTKTVETTVKPVTTMVVIKAETAVTTPS